MQDRHIIIAIPGINHRPSCFDALAHNLATLGWQDFLALDPGVVPVAESISLPRAAASSPP